MPCLVDLREYVQILAHFAFGFSDAVDRFVQVIERGGTAARIKSANGGDGFVNRFAGDEAGGHFLKGRNRAAKSLSPSWRER